MRKTLSILLLTSLTACSSLSGIIVAPFDNNEYLLVDKIRTESQIGKCDQASIDGIYVESLELKNYSQYLPKNAKSYEMTQNLFTVVDELHQKQNPSAVYCSAKLNIISKSAEEIQQVMGNRPR